MRPDNILLIRLSSIGDVLHCTPVARTLREHFPQARISWLVGEKSQEILHGNPDLDNIILWQREKWEQELRKGSWQKSVADFRMLTQQLKNERYDMVIDLQGLLLTGLIGWRSGARTRIGFRQAREGSALFYTHRVRNEHRLQIVHHYLQLLRPLGIRRFNTQMVMPLAQRHYDFASNLFSSQHINEDQDRVIILNPSTSWPTKCWPPAYYARLANLLGTGLAAKIMLLGAPGDVPLLKEISAGISQPVINLAGKTNLKELAAVVQKSHLFISGDTGPLHIAAAVGTPTLSLFGPTDPQVYAPLDEKHAAIVSDARCRYCHKRSCAHSTCMGRILPEDVYLAARKIIQQKPQKKYMEATPYGEVTIKTIPAAV
ncbi:MAG TPA: putative lipopolysaccharide heptosyltransferase III [Negativicutes bacterium]|nr:putative lipopolysaccharide heptosyltransferase III [Negativicutes bacterium]